MSDYFDAIETRDAQLREKEIFEKLPEFLAEISSSISGWSERLSGLNLAEIVCLSCLAGLARRRMPRHFFNDYWQGLNCLQSSTMGRNLSRYRRLRTLKRGLKWLQEAISLKIANRHWRILLIQ